MRKSNKSNMKKGYIKPEVTSYEVEQDAYACGSGTSPSFLLIGHDIP